MNSFPRVYLQEFRPSQAALVNLEKAFMTCAAVLSVKAAHKDLYPFFQVTRPRLKYTLGTGQKTAEIVVVCGSLIGVINGVVYAAQR